LGLAFPEKFRPSPRENTYQVDFEPESVGINPDTISISMNAVVLEIRANNLYK
jgi:hypothetical protein